MTKLSYEEWNQLDDLLDKHGVAGYYDMVECLKMVANDYGKDVLKENWEHEIKDLPDIFHLLMAIYSQSSSGSAKSG